MKTHLIVGQSFNKVRTACGREGFRDKMWSDEFDEADNRRFEAVIDPKRVTCQRCRARAVAGGEKP